MGGRGVISDLENSLRILCFINRNVGHEFLPIAVAMNPKNGFNFRYTSDKSPPNQFNSRHIKTSSPQISSNPTFIPSKLISISRYLQTHLNAFPARNLRFSSVSCRPQEALNFIFRVFATCNKTKYIINIISMTFISTKQKDCVPMICGSDII